MNHKVMSVGRSRPEVLLQKSEEEIGFVGIKNGSFKTEKKKIKAQRFRETEKKKTSIGRE